MGIGGAEIVDRAKARVGSNVFFSTTSEQPSMDASRTEGLDQCMILSSDMLSTLEGILSAANTRPSDANDIFEWITDGERPALGESGSIDRQAA